MTRTTDRAIWTLASTIGFGLTTRWSGVAIAGSIIIVIVGVAGTLLGANGIVRGAGIAA